MRKRIKRFILLALLMALGGTVGAYAQANSTLTGIVTDQTEAVVAGATVTLTDPATGATKETETGPSGLYTISGLNPATYILKITAKGFESYIQSGVVVNALISSAIR